MAPTYHLELRRFPKASTRFNLDGRELGAIVLPWVQERVIELDGVKWAPYESSITIIEGPAIPLDRLSMGRGWKIALREGADVTERVLSEARDALRGGEAGAETHERAVQAAARAAEGAEAVAALLGADAERLLGAWHRVAARTAGLAPSEALALAERELQAGGGSPDGPGRR